VICPPERVRLVLERGKEPSIEGLSGYSTVAGGNIEDLDGFNCDNPAEEGELKYSRPYRNFVP